MHFTRKEKSAEMQAGVEANNPAFEAIDLATKFQKDVGVLVSVGTGKRLNYYDAVEGKDSIITLPGEVVDWLTETESTHSKVESFCTAKTIHCFRFQPELSTKLLKMSLDSRQIEKLKKAVRRYLQKPQVQKDLDRLVNVLIHNTT
jgi:hypothetical protein